MLVALAGGFAGVLLIIQPGGAAFTWWYLLGCAFFFAGYQILTRKFAGRRIAASLAAGRRRF